MWAHRHSSEATFVLPPPWKPDLAAFLLDPLSMQQGRADPSRAQPASFRKTSEARLDSKALFVYKMDGKGECYVCAGSPTSLFEAV